MKTLVIYITFEDENEQLIEHERRALTEGLWGSEVPAHVMHEYRDAKSYEKQYYREVYPPEGDTE